MFCNATVQNSTFSRTVSSFPSSSYLQKSMSTNSSSRSAWPITGRKKSSVMRLGVMLCSVEAVRRIRAKRSWCPVWMSWTTSLRACWASCCKPSTKRAAFKSGTSVGWKHRKLVLDLVSALNENLTRRILFWMRYRGKQTWIEYHGPFEVCIFLWT